MRLLMSMILYCPDLNTAEQETQVCNTVSEILMYKARKRKQKEDSASSQQSLKREPPVPLYVGLNIHTLARNKGIVDRFEKLGLSVPYDRVLQVERPKFMQTVQRKKKLSVCHLYAKSYTL